MRFDVAVNNAIGMGFFQGIADFNGNADSCVNGDVRVVLDILLQGLPFHIFHDDIVDIAVAAHVVDTHNIWMGQFARGLGFMAEADDEIVVLRKTAVQNFDCHNPVKKDIPGLVYISHSA